MPLLFVCFYSLYFFSPLGFIGYVNPLVLDLLVLDRTVPQPIQTSVGEDALNSVISIQVLVHGDLEDRGRPLTSGNDRVGQKVDPNSVPSFAILGNDLVLVGQPVEVPPVNGGRVVDTEDVDAPDLKVGVLELSRREE